MAEVLDNKTIKALGTDTRQDIIKHLQKRPYTASELSKELGKHVTTVTEHLVVLEESGLVAKRDSTNKWVYYTLTSKGEKIFKPNFYSWIIVLSLSVIALVSGSYQIFFIPQTNGAFPAAEKALDQAAITTAVQNVPASGLEQYLGVALAALGILGIAYAFFLRKDAKTAQASAAI